MKITTYFGVVLDDEMYMAGTMNRYIESKGLENTKAYYVEQYNTYILAVNGQIDYESTVAENIGVHIDILAIKNNKEVK